MQKDHEAIETMASLKVRYRRLGNRTRVRVQLSRSAGKSLHGLELVPLFLSPKLHFVSAS